MVLLRQPIQQRGYAAHVGVCRVSGHRSLSSLQRRAWAMRVLTGACCLHLRLAEGRRSAAGGQQAQQVIQIVVCHRLLRRGCRLRPRRIRPVDDTTRAGTL